MDGLPRNYIEGQKSLPHSSRRRGFILTSLLTLS